ncbi:hypothetical protein U9M48_025274 [Paspalum notatum var. saurae]|uniref:Reverse transcriptase domain-containing protein n=1 Tax=Paspalum notatum var. saurae TaxID=547442 RepID=A0AAQ3TQE7_PASNO
MRLDRAQDSRRLSPDEATLRADVKLKCLGLSSLERTIARLRSRVRQLSDGDANTKFFHILARGKKRKIIIPELVSDGRTAVSHEEMQAMIQEYFGKIFGISAVRERSINLAALGLSRLDLSGLEEPFTEEEVLAAIRELPVDRAPGPDGFTGAFYKAGWGVIKADLLAALNSFYAGVGRGFHKLNNGLIVLLPKKPDATGPGDYRPIAMIHSFGKLVSKILAMRLAPFMQQLITSNQTAYIRGRSILDSYKFVHSAAVHLRKRKIPKLLLKLDISKAFDSLAWSFLLEVLQCLGFGNRWRDWIAILLSSASSKILLNRCPGEAIRHQRGVRQGDSLSPLLFILAMEVLSRLFSRAEAAGLLPPLEIPAVRNRCSLYADNVILFVNPIPSEAQAVKQLLRLFGDAAGLKINLHKCSVSPVSCQERERELSAITDILNCARLLHSRSAGHLSRAATALQGVAQGLLTNPGRQGCE